MIDRTQTVGKQAKESPGNSPMFKTKRKPSCTPTGAAEGEETLPHFFLFGLRQLGKKTCVFALKHVPHLYMKQTLIKKKSLSLKFFAN